MAPNVVRQSIFTVPFCVNYQRQTGFVLGKFMPPHKGHEFLCNTATQLCDQLTILVCSVPGDPMPGALRQEWMQKLFPDAHVLHYDQDIPQEPADDPQFWSIWRDLIKQLHPTPIDRVFGSDPYVHRLAQELNAECVIIDPDREAVPISASSIRSNPLTHWNLLPDLIKPYFLKRVCLFGPESTGKTTLAKSLAAHYRTSYMPEYGRIYDEQYRPDAWISDHLVTIAQVHEAMRRALEPLANRVMIEDTDAVLTAVWSDTLIGYVDPWFASTPELADLYLLTDIDVPWVNDGLRLFGTLEERRAFFDKAKGALDERGGSYVTLTGDWDTRRRTAISAIDRLLAIDVPPDSLDIHSPDGDHPNIDAPGS